MQVQWEIGFPPFIASISLLIALSTREKALTLVVPVVVKMSREPSIL